MTDPFARWEEFEKRLMILINGGHHKHRGQKLREWLRRNGERSVSKARRLHKEGDPAFKNHVADAEKCRHILAILEGLDLSQEEAA